MYLFFLDYFVMASLFLIFVIKFALIFLLSYLTSHDTGFQIWSTIALYPSLFVSPFSILNMSSPLALFAWSSRRDYILCSHGRIMEVQSVLRCTGAMQRATRRSGVSARAERAFQQKESGRPFVFRVPRCLFAGLECQNEPGRDLHADLRAGSNRLISNRFGPRRVSPPFSSFLRPLPSSSIHVHFSFFFFTLHLCCLLFLACTFLVLPSSLSLSLSFSFTWFHRVPHLSSSTISFSLAGFLQSRHGRD